MKKDYYNYFIFLVMIKKKINEKINCSFYKIKQEKFEEISQYLNEAMRVNKQNLKTLYRMAYYHYKNEKFDNAKKDIKNALEVIKKKKEMNLRLNN